ncbi:zinc transporter [Abyssisolibacter fermentans]|uniref:zinc transporter n=1 Tax=Abyssisolibacter fermentans TaxID=1766203 RepID=UPI0008330C7D|nr:zinc transporter [Abyssisolibacter fermentans]
MCKEHSHIHTHDHDHNHEHTHDHDCCCSEHTHSHTHEHEHDCCCDGISKEEKTLRVLLAHWIQHNKSHTDDFEQWIVRAKEMGKEETAEYIKKAVEFIDSANNMLLEAKKRM